MLVVDHVGDHHVADVGVEGRGFAQHVHAGHPCRLLGDLAEDVIRGLTQRVVDVDDARV